MRAKIFSNHYQMAAFTDSDNPLARLQLEQLYNQYVQEQMLHNVPSQDIASFGYFSSHLAHSWQPNQIQPERKIHSKQNEDNRLEKYSELENVESSVMRLEQQVELGTKHRMTDAEAVVVIQRAWRRHIDIQVYKYYRDLINFRSRGDPSVMLRCINPNEAKLLDAASGINVRFRLAGERFPPNIYYKIFTKRPIQDMCANSPKDYTAAEAKPLVAKDAHNQMRVKNLPYDDKDGWYRRVENNGWRLVSDRLLTHIMNDPVTWDTSRKEYKFDHSKMQRRQDVERRKKQKKIEWMQKMYREGMLKARSTDDKTVELIEGAAAGMMATVETHGPEALEEWEVDELLDWTTSLNFDEYRSIWADLGTSTTSNNFMDDKTRFSGLNEPYEVSVSTGPSRFTSARQSELTIRSSESGKPLKV